MLSSNRIANWLALVIALAGGAVWLGPARAEGPSDCRKAGLPVEKTICADPQLSAIDALVAKAFVGFEPAFGGDKRKIARALIADRNACGQDAACIVSAQNNALLTYGNAPSWCKTTTSR
jgi:uncharacterized protein